MQRRGDQGAVGEEEEESKASSKTTTQRRRWPAAQEAPRGAGSSRGVPRPPRSRERAASWTGREKERKRCEESATLFFLLFCFLVERVG